jgi:ribosomal protein S12 methylthiotransferase
MVGFPGETEEHFQELLNLVQEYELDNVGVFTYSNEELAWSSRLPDHVSEEVKQDRYHCIMQVQLEVTGRKNQALLDQEKCLEVVIEGFHTEHDALIVGRCFGQCPDIDGQAL